MSGPGKKRPTLVADRRFPKAGAKRKPAPKKPAPKKRRAAGRRKSPPRGPIGRLFAGLFALVRWVVWSVFALAWRGALIVALLVGGAAFYFAATLPDVRALVDGRARGSVTMVDRSGAIFAWRGDQFGGMITASTVSPHLKNAVVATEDKRFYRHIGVSPRGVASAVRINLSEGRGPLSGHGGSTLTQQTAKLVCLGVPFDPDTWQSEAAYEADCREGSVWRKVKEATFALGMELKYTKDEILTIYLNRAFLGAGSRGFEAAAQRYFGKSSANVTPAEAAMLAGLLVAPTRFAPTNNIERSRDRAATVLKLMNEQGYISDAQRAEAVAKPASLSKAAEQRVGGYFADWVMSTGPEFFTRDTTEDVLLKTTLDQRIQRAAEDAVKLIFDTKVRQGSKAETAVVVMSADGAIRAMVGGRDTKVNGAFNRATQAKRQTGSVFKPFVYATALELGAGPNDTVLDAPLCLDIPGSGEWCPKNYSDEFAGEVTLTTALARSLNTPAVRLSEQVGRDLVRQVATDFGIQNDLAAGPALALGASESTLVEMVGAYAGILNGGSSVTPYGLLELKLQGDSNALMGQGGGIGERVVSPQAAQALTYMMHQVIEGGTGQRAKIAGFEVAGKTGTTQAARDAWFIGFTADYVTGVWMGYDDNTPLTGVTGSGLPADIWREVMARIHDGLEPKPLPMLRTVAPAAVEAPRTPGSTTTANSNEALRDRLAPNPVEDSGDVVDNAIKSLLRDLLGVD